MGWGWVLGEVKEKDEMVGGKGFEGSRMTEKQAFQLTFIIQLISKHELNAWRVWLR